MSRAADQDGEAVVFSVTDGIEPATEPTVADLPPAGLAARTKIALSLVGLLALAGVLAVQQARRDGPPAALAPVSSPAASPSHSTAPPAALPTGPQVVLAGRPLLDVPAGWQLFGRGPTGVVRIELASGRVTRTMLPGLNSSGPVSFVVGADRAIVRPLDFVAGYAVLDGRAGQELAGSAMKSGPLLPGPDPRHVWTPSVDGAGLRLTTLGGAQLSQFLPVNPISAFSDQAGYAAFQGVGGVYDAGPHGVHRITTGALLAAGPTRWLTYDCDDSAACRLMVIDRATGAKRVLRSPVRPDGSRGLIAPDGRTAALIVSTGAGLRLNLLDLRTGAIRRSELALAADVDEAALVWSPDSRWLFVTGANGRLSVLDARSWQSYELPVNLPALSQLAFRQR